MGWARRLLLPLAGVVAGVVVVLAVAAVAGLLTDDDPADPVSDPGDVAVSFPAIDHDEAAAQELVLAWERWRTATFVATGTWSRTLDGSDESLQGEVRTVQDPPRRRVVRLGAVVEEIDATVAQCDAPTDELIVPGCTEVELARTYEERVTAEMTLVLAYVFGPERIYDVARDGECFRVELVEAALRSPWGRAARFCFDDATGALSSSLVRRQNAVDRETTIEILGEVTDADF